MYVAMAGPSDFRKLILVGGKDAAFGTGWWDHVQTNGGTSIEALRRI